MRNISFSATKEQFRARSKTVTRRLGWEKLSAGDILMGVEKAQGLKKGEKVVKLGPIRIVSVRREPLDAITQADVADEGFPDLTPAQFVAMFCEVNRPCQHFWIVTRIEFEYLTTTTTSATPTAALPSAAPFSTSPAEEGRQRLSQEDI